MLSVLFSIPYFFLLGIFGTFAKFIKFVGYLWLNITNYTFFGQLFICLVKDIPTAMALAGAIIGINLLGTGFLIKPGGNFLTSIAYYFSPQQYIFQGILMSQLRDISQTVVALDGSAYFESLNCTPGQSDCHGNMESYANFAFNGEFSFDHRYRGVFVPLSFAIVAMIGTHWSLGHLNYVNT